MLHELPFLAEIDSEFQQTADSRSGNQSNQLGDPNWILGFPWAHTLSCWRSLDFAELLVHSKKSLIPTTAPLHLRNQQIASLTASSCMSIPGGPIAARNDRSSVRGSAGARGGCGCGGSAVAAACAPPPPASRTQGDRQSTEWTVVGHEWRSINTGV
eukprot:SAG25_NODE_714_length_5789_cov_9.025294_3_plen_157_part_00